MTRHLIRTAFCFVALAACAEDVRIVRGPHVETVGRDAAAISWATEKPGDSRVAYGITPSFGAEVADQNLVTEHRVVLDGLRPGRTYHYRVASAGSEAEASFIAGVWFDRGPYAQHVTETETSILWGVAPSAEASVFLEADGQDAVEQRGEGRVRFEGLTPGTPYHYRVTAHGVSSAQGRFRTNASADSTVTFALYGDSRSNPKTHTRVVERILTHSFDFVIHSGDFVNDGRVEAEWGPMYFEPTRPLGLRAPIYPAIGNHEKDSALYYSYFEVSPNGSTKRPEAWYAFDYGPAHFAVLDTNDESGELEAGTEQRVWLETDLASSRARWKFVVVHHPAYSSGYHKSNLTIRRNLVPLCERLDVDVVLTGHEHCYERTWPLRGDKRVDRGVVQVVSGGGGAPLYKVGRSSWTAVSESVPHYCTITIRGGRLDLDVYDVEGRSIDALTLHDDDTYVETLAGHLEGSTAERKMAIEELGRTGLPRVVSHVRPYTGDADGATRAAVAQAVARAGTSESAEVLHDLLADAEPAVRRWAVWGMGIAGSSRGLRARLSDEDVEVRRLAAKGLQLSPDPSSVSALAKAVADPDPSVRLAVVRALVSHDGSNVALFGAILDENAEVRGAAIRGAIERKLFAGAAESIAGVLPELDGKLLVEAVEALGLSGDTSIAPALVSVLRHEAVPIRRAAAIGLGRLKARAGVEGLIQALEDKDRGVRMFALRALRTTTDERLGDDADAWRRWLAGTQN